MSATHPALTSKLSAQVKYRPVLQQDIPGLPNPDRPDYQYCRRWWTEQLRRCTEGWICPEDKVFINPIYYFYLNFVKVYVIDELNGKKAGWMAPYFRDGDKEYFDAVYYNRARSRGDVTIDAKNLIVAKGRRKGWTTAELYGITQWYFLFEQGFNISRAYPNDKIKRKERRLFARSYEETHEFFKRNLRDEPIDILVNNEEEISQWTYTENPTNGVRHKEKQVNSIQFFTVSADGGGVRGDALILIVLVEAGLHTHLKAFMAAAEETLSLGTYKFGMILIGGTSDAINNESTDYKDMFYSPADYNATRLFTPAWKCYFGALDYLSGRSIREKSVPYILAKRQEMEAAGDYERLRLFIQEHPLIPEEAFIPAGHSEYDEIKIDQQIMAILRSNMDSEWVRGRLEYETDTYGERTGKIFFEKNAAGHWLILEHYGVPNMSVENLYVAGIDDVYKDKAPYSDSKNCMIVFMRDSVHVEGLCDLPVAFYFGRHGNRMIDYEEFAKGTKYYNSKVMYEHNDSSGYIGFARDQGIGERFLYHNGQIGVRLSEEIKADMTLMGLKYFAEDRHKRILHSELAKSFKYWGSDRNNDIASAFHLVFFGLKKMEKHGTNESKESKNAVAPFRFGAMQYSTDLFNNRSNVGYFKFGSIEQD